MSLQEYLRAELRRNARTRSPDEVAADAAARIRVAGGAGFAHTPSASLRREVRDSR